MGKAGRWLRSFLAGKKDGGGRRSGERQQHGGGDATPAVEVVAASTREKKRWSFRRSSASASAAAMGKPAAVTAPSTPEPSVSGLASVSERARDVADLEGQSKHAMAVAAVATAAEGDDVSASAVEVVAAVMIQATYRGYLARKALCALRGLVKLQALIRGNLVRKQATATLRRMQALLVAQARLRAQRMRMLEEEEDDDVHGHGHHHHRRSSPHHPRHRRSYEMDRSGEEQAKIVEVDRSSSHVGVPAAHGYHHHHLYSYGQYPWSVKQLDRSSASLKDSECGSTTSSVLTAATTVGYCRSLVGFDLHRGHY
uniref:DUF4005 domain-containing protein n=1 Tax=Oryza barthii TaxID=65489 RepID=A0A0D3HDR4_9ORYZ